MPQGVCISALARHQSRRRASMCCSQEVVDNSIDEYMMGFGRQLDIAVSETGVTVATMPRHPFEESWSMRRRR